MECAFPSHFYHREHRGSRGLVFILECLPAVCHLSEANLRGVRGTHTLIRKEQRSLHIRKNRGFPPSLETRPGIPLAEHASEDALNASNKRVSAKGPSGLCGSEGMVPLNS